MSAPTMAPPPAAPSPPRRSRLPIVAGACAVVLVLLAAAMLLYDHSRRDQIAKGVTIAGVNVGGMSEAAARAKIQRELIAQLNEPVTVHAGKRHWRLSAREAGLAVDAGNMVSQAVSASRGGSIFSRTFRGLFGGSVKHNVPLVVSYSHRAVRGLTAKVRASVNRPPRDATVAPSSSGLNAVPAAAGLTVDNARLGGDIDRALASTGAGRNVAVPVHGVKPAVTTSQLAAKYPAYIVVSRSEFRLRFYEHLKLAKTYEIAVGMEGLETPAGLHHIEWEQVDPPWYVPKSVGRRARRHGRPARPGRPAEGALHVLRRRRRHPRDRPQRVQLDRPRRLARVHPHAHPRRDRAVQQVARRHARLHHLEA